nr:RNA degradosome polyphosphate kinase [Peribacillus kribbensis]
MVRDLDNPKYFNNRELSWLAFNKRVLEEAASPDNPILERLKFLAIFSSNLDEFFMVRVAGLKELIKARFSRPDNKAGLTPKEQITEITDITHHLVSLQYKTLKKLLSSLEEEGISFLPISDLDSEELEYLEYYFDDIIFPVLTPMAIDAYRPFPLLANKSMNLAVLLKDNKNEEADQKLAIVQVPRSLERFIEIRNKVNHHKRYVLMEHIICHFVHKLFLGSKVESVTQFRLTRNADLEIHEEGARDLLREIEEEVKMRRWGASVRLEIAKQFIDDAMLEYLVNEFEIHKRDVYFVKGPLDLTFLFGFYKTIAPLKDNLIFESLIPQPPKDLITNIKDNRESIFDIAAAKDILLHHPYESFEPVIDLIRCAADDPNVLAIKQTLYRVSEHSPIITYLKKAAENGKQVLVLLELKARFDEEHNVHWAKELEKSGCQVIYGKTLLKTHSKVTLIVHREARSIKYIVHLGTGNYNEETAKVYTDLSLITSNREIGMDATNFFNYLSGYSKKPDFHQFSISPMDIKSSFIQLIDEEIENHKINGNGRIIAKMNSFTEKELIMKFYEASMAGVQIDLIVRGICCLRPGIKGISENIRVRSIVGRFLEHSRIYYFYQNGKEKLFLSSADLMTRNMEKRVEIAFPILKDEIKRRIKDILDLMLNDNVKAREQDDQGNYSYIERKPNEPLLDSQLELFDSAYKVSHHNH